MNDLKIIVVGATNTGKSTIAQLIKEALSNAGFDVVNTDDDEINYPVENDIQLLRINNTLLRHPKIEILSQQLARKSSYS